MSEADIAVEPMRLRADPPGVARLSRKVLMSIGAVAALGVGGALIYALQSEDSPRHGEELYSTSNRQPADGLANLPHDYEGPILGPPLPGDLGKPFLDARNEGQAVMPPAIANSAVDEAEQRRRAEEEAARTSRVFFQTGQGGTGSVEGSGAPGVPNLDGLAAQSGEPSAQDRKLAFLNAAADRRTVAPDRIMPPVSAYVLQAGAVIPAALVTGIPVGPARPDQRSGDREGL